MNLLLPCLFLVFSGISCRGDDSDYDYGDDYDGDYDGDYEEIDECTFYESGHKGTHILYCTLETHIYVCVEGSRNTI